MPTRKISEVTETHVCRHPDHDPPKHRVFEPGIYEHKCAGCGEKKIFVIKRVTLEAVAQPRSAIQQVAPRPSWCDDMKDAPVFERLRGD